MDFITENLLLNIGGMGLATLSLGLLWYVFKGYQKVMTNHLAHTDKTQRDDIASREKLAGLMSSQQEINKIQIDISKETLGIVRDMREKL